MKRVLSALLVLALAAGAVLLAVHYYSAKAPERTVKRMMNALQSAKISKAEKYTVNSSLQLSSTTRRAKKFYKAMLGQSSYAVVGSEVDGNTATVVVAVTALDMETLIGSASLSMLDRTLDGKRGATREFYSTLTADIHSGDADTTSTNVTVYLVKSGRGWKVDMEKSKKIASAVTGGVPELLGY